MSRKIDVDLQSPGLARSAAGSYITQVNAIDDPDVRRVLMPGKGEHIHHKAILKTLTPLYKGLSESEAAELTAYLNQYGGIGNHIQNLIRVAIDTFIDPFFAIDLDNNGEPDFDRVKKLHVNILGVHIRYGEFLVELLKTILIIVLMYQVIMYLIHNTDIFE